MLFFLDSRFVWEAYNFRIEYPWPQLKDPPPELVKSSYIKYTLNMLFNKETGKYRHFQTAKHIPFPVLLRLLQFAEYHIFGKER